MPMFTLIVSAAPVPGAEAEWNRWYDDVHLGEVTKIPGFISAQRLSGCGDTGLGKANLALYRIEAADAGAAEDAVDRLKAAPLTPSDAMDLSTVTFSLYVDGVSVS